MSATAAIVTGAGRGIGRAIALELAGDGLSTLCISRSSSCEETRDEIRRRSGTATSMVMDLADYQGAERDVRVWVTDTELNRYVVVLAAAELGPRGPLSSSDVSEWEHTLRVNVLGNLAVLRAVLDRMIQAKFGRIVFLGGGGAAYEYPAFPAYAATKTAVVRIVENLALDLQTVGDFSVVCLAPGAVETDMLAEIRRTGAEIRTPADVDEAVAFVKAFAIRDAASLSGRFVHVRDEWKRLLSDKASADELWKLRRVE